MSGAINRLLRGYIDLFALRSGGRNPQSLAEFIQPTIDLQRWYLESEALLVYWQIPFAAAGSPYSAGQIALNSTVPVNLTNGFVLTVPQTEIWLLLPGTWTGISFSAHAGSNGFPGTYTIGDSVATQEVPMSTLAGFSASDATRIVTARRALQDPFWVGPGMLIQAYQHGLTVGAGGTITIEGGLKVARLRI